jgi:4-diphosphocytidyl-2-C-methyl-D-erythritol kinase
VDKISLNAPAKINLYLQVLGKRPDGYHEIDSLMQAIDLYDHITIEKSDSIELECDDPSIPSDSSNLAFKAAALLQRAAYFPGARIILKKRIPSGSGLGGGSSDAAFVLRGLSQLYNLDLSAEQKKEIAGEIGSDVPFFLSSGQAIVEGRGEKIFPVKTPLDYGVIVITPPIMSSTADTYRKLKIVLTKSPPSTLLKRGIESSSFYRLMKSFRNDLEEVVLVDIPELKNLKEILIEAGCLYSAVTGSGSAVFGITRFSGKKDYNFDIDIGRGYRVFQCRPVLLPPF